MDLNEKNERINNNGEAEQEGEDEKIDKFFALIRSFRDARDRRRNELQELEIMRKKNKNEMKTNLEMMMMMKKKKKRTKAEHEEHKSSWVPSFEWEDFSEDHHHHHHQYEFRKPPLIFPDPCIKKNYEQAQNDQKDEETGLDLKLAL